MWGRVRQKIEHWRSQPEHIRVRLATRLTWGTGAVLIILWLAVLLPFQLYIARDDAAEPAIQGIQATSTPSPIVTPAGMLPN